MLSAERYAPVVSKLLLDRSFVLVEIGIANKAPENRDMAMFLKPTKGLHRTLRTHDHNNDFVTARAALV